MKLLACLLALASPTHAQDGRPAECLLKVQGQEVIRGTCIFTPLDADGSFQIMSLDDAFFAQVLMDRPGFGTGYWNGEANAGHAHSPLGALKRRDACWINQGASVCAW